MNTLKFIKQLVKTTTLIFLLCISFYASSQQGTTPVELQPKTLLDAETYDLDGKLVIYVGAEETIYGCPIPKVNCAINV